MSLGQRPDEDVAKPELPIKVPKTNLKNNCEARECVQKTFRHLIVLPASHEVLVRFNVIPHLLRGDHLEMAHLEHHPAAPLRFQVAIHLEKVGNLVTFHASRVTFQGPCAWKRNFLNVIFGHLLSLQGRTKLGG